MSAFKDDIRYKEGRKMLAAGNSEAAIEFFSELLQDRVSTYGEQSLEVAPAWFEYGRALLLKEQDNPTDDLLGAVAAEAKKQALSLGDQLSSGQQNGVEEEEEEEEEGEGEEEEENQGQEVTQEEDVTDMEIAWEALEMSRKLFEEEQDPAYDLTLSEVYESLGDVSKFNGNFADAITEYSKSLKLREAVCEDSDRILAQAYYTLAVAYVYLAAEESCTDPLTQKKRALKNYQAARKVLMADLKNGLPAIANTSTVTSSSSGTSSSSSSSSSSGGEEKKTLSETEERKELSDEIEETIIALKDEIMKESLGLNNNNTSSSSAGSTTTIGFGSSSSSSSSTSIGFGSSSSSSSSSTSSIDGSTQQPLLTKSSIPLEVKKKKLNAGDNCSNVHSVTPPETSQVDSTSSDNGSDQHAPKKQKIY